MRFLAFINEWGIKMMEVLYRKKDGSYISIRELIEKTRYDSLNANQLMRDLKYEELVEEHYIDGELPVGRGADRDRFTYRLSDKGKKLVKDLRKIRRLAEANDLL